jgi:hypothetical protein
MGRLELRSLYPLAGWITGECLLRGRPGGGKSPIFSTFSGDTVGGRKGRLGAHQGEPDAGTGTNRDREF